MSETITPIQGTAGLFNNYSPTFQTTQDLNAAVTSAFSALVQANALVSEISGDSDSVTAGANSAAASATQAATSLASTTALAATLPAYATAAAGSAASAATSATSATTQAATAVAQAAAAMASAATAATQAAAASASSTSATSAANQASGSAATATTQAGIATTAATSAAGVATVAALLALPFSTFQNNAVITVAAYNVQGDGGGGQWQWQAGNTSPDDLVFTRNPTGNTGPGRVVRINYGIPHFKLAGMPISGTGDATAAITAFWAAMSALNGGAGGAGYGNDGVWNVSSQLVRPANVDMLHGSRCFYVATAPIYATGSTTYANSRQYALGALVNANGNLYQCTAGGLSSSTGTGPSGFTTGITDGAATFSYVALSFAALITTVGSSQMWATQWNGGTLCCAFQAAGFENKFSYSASTSNVFVLDAMAYHFKFGDLAAAGATLGTLGINLCSELSVNFPNAPKTPIPTTQITVSSVTTATAANGLLTVTLQLPSAHGLTMNANAHFVVSGFTPAAYNVTTVTQNGLIGYATMPDQLTYQVPAGTAAPTGTGVVTLQQQPQIITNWGPSFPCSGVIYDANAKVATYVANASLGLNGNTVNPMYALNFAPAGWNIVAPFAGPTAATCVGVSLQCPVAFNPGGALGLGVSPLQCSVSAAGSGYALGTRVSITFPSSSASGGRPAQGFALISGGSPGPISAVHITDCGLYASGDISANTVINVSGGTGGTITVAGLVQCSIPTTLGTMVTVPTSVHASPLDTTMPNGMAGLIFANMTDCNFLFPEPVGQDMSMVTVGSTGDIKVTGLHGYNHTSFNQISMHGFLGGRSGNSSFTQMYPDGVNLCGYFLNANNQTFTDTTFFRGQTSGLTAASIVFYDNYGNQTIRGLKILAGALNSTFGTAVMTVQQDIVYGQTYYAASTIASDIDTGSPNYLNVRTIPQTVVTSGTVPNSKNYLVGDIWKSANPAAFSAQATCTTSGYYATQAYTNNTPIAAGIYIYAGSNVYKVTTGGTTATSGSGPTGTGAAVTDGSVVFAYVAPLAVFNFPPSVANFSGILPVGATSVISLGTLPGNRNATLNVGLTVVNSSTQVVINTFYYDSVTGLNTTLQPLGNNGTSLAVGRTSYPAFLPTVGGHGIYVQVTNNGSANNVIANAQILVT